MSVLRVVIDSSRGSSQVLVVDLAPYEREDKPQQDTLKSATASELLSELRSRLADLTPCGEADEEDYNPCTE